jgi:hypothetical protein
LSVFGFPSASQTNEKQREADSRTRNQLSRARDIPLLRMLVIGGEGTFVTGFSLHRVL